MRSTFVRFAIRNRFVIVEKVKLHKGIDKIQKVLYIIDTGKE